MARTTMTDLIARLRGFAQAGTADYTVAGVAYWTDDQLQAVLDRYRLEIYREQLASIETYSGGTIQWINYQSAYNNWENTDGGTAVFEVEDSVGTTIGTASWAADYPSGRLVFTSDTGGETYYLTGRTYDVFGAAADVWRQKGGQYAGQVNFKTDNMSVDRGALRQQALSMADEYERRSRGAINVVTMYRSDWYGA